MSGTQWRPWGRAGTLARAKLRPGGRARIRPGAEQVGCPLPSDRVQSQDGCQGNGAGEAHSVRRSAGDRTVSVHGFGKAGALVIWTNAVLGEWEWALPGGGERNVRP